MTSTTIVLLYFTYMYKDMNGWRQQVSDFLNENEKINNVYKRSKLPLSLLRLHKEEKHPLSSGKAPFKYLIFFSFIIFPVETKY